jgi:hypothetical protein
MGDAVQSKIITSEQFAAMPDFDAPYVELIEGEIVMAGGASNSHQGRSLDLIRFLLNNVRGGTLRFAPTAAAKRSSRRRWGSLSQWTRCSGALKM